jgi:hypothetical protein
MMFIKFLSKNFVLAIQNPIRTLCLLDVTFWLVVLRVWVQNSYSKVLWLWGQVLPLCNLSTCTWQGYQNVTSNKHSVLIGFWIASTKFLLKNLMNIMCYMYLPFKPNLESSRLISMNYLMVLMLPGFRSSSIKCLSFIRTRTILINILQWILTKLGTYLVLRRVWNPINFQGHGSKVKVSGSNI